MSYPAGATYTLSSDGAAIVLTAQWSANATDDYSFNAAGGSPTPSSGSGLDGTTITLPGAPTWAGYTFAGWNDGTLSYPAGATYTLSSDGAAIVLTAQWSANATDDYSFNAAGGSPTPSSGSGLDGTTITLPGAPTWAGYTFAGWNDGTLSYPAGATYTLSSDGAAIVLTAQWSANATDDYSFNAAGGSPTPSSGSGLDGTTITLPGAPTWAGYTFAGWNDGTLSYPAGATYTLSSDGAAIVLTAQWSANATITISFNSEGGSAVSAVTGLEGTTVTLPAAPTYAGYTFAGWFTAPSGGTGAHLALHPRAPPRPSTPSGAPTPPMTTASTPRVVRPPPARVRASTAPPSPCPARPRGPATPSPGGTTAP